MLRVRFGVRRQLVTAVPPMGDFPLLPPLLKWTLGAQSQRLAEALARDIEAEPDCTLLAFTGALMPDDMAEDGFHPGAPAYRAWAQAAAAQILP